MRIPIEGWAGTSFALNVRPGRSRHFFASIHARVVALRFEVSRRACRDGYAAACPGH